MPKWRQPIRVFFLLLGLLLFSNIVAPPAAEALLIGTKQEIEIGKGVANDLEKKYGLVNDPALQARVARLGASIPMMEQRSLQRRPDYQRVIDRVSRFVPTPPHRAAT